MITAEQIGVLVNKNVEMVCFAQYSVYIHVQDSIMITMNAGFQYIHGKSQEEYRAESPIAESSLMTVLESSIVSASVDSNGVLLFVFSNGDRLTVFREPEFESYSLKIGREELIV
jgi:hypothetical protein